MTLPASRPRRSPSSSHLPRQQDNPDVSLFLKVLGDALRRFNPKVLACCLMTIPSHKVIVTAQGGLYLLMPQIKAVCSQTYNRRHRVTGHLLQCICSARGSERREQFDAPQQQSVTRGRS